MGIYNDDPPDPTAMILKMLKYLELQLPLPHTLDASRIAEVVSTARNIAEFTAHLVKIYSTASLPRPAPAAPDPREVDQCPAWIPFDNGDGGKTYKVFCQLPKDHPSSTHRCNSLAWEDAPCGDSHNFLRETGEAKKVTCEFPMDHTGLHQSGSYNWH